MIVVLGASGYVGSAFVAELTRRRAECLALSRRTVDYTDFRALLAFLRERRPAFLINAAGYTGKPNVDACESRQADTLQGNTLLVATVAHACEVAGIPWGHVSSGCIYSGAKILTPGGARIERDLQSPQAREALARARHTLRGFSEADEPNFTFRAPPCSFYSGTKALAEELLRGAERHYVWRLRIPFDEFDNPRNYLTKLQSYPRVYDNANSLSHRHDFVRACLDLWEHRAPFGTYNVTNPGFVTTRDVVALIERHLQPARPFAFFASDEEFYQQAAKAPRSNCLLDVSKLLATGVSLRPVEEALADALKNWRPAARPDTNSSGT
jgi:UDP-glucose 4,6-dehydratase